MKLNLLLDKEKPALIDLEKLQSKINDLKALFSHEKNYFDQKTEQLINDYDFIESITLLLNDFGHSVTWKETQNILNKKNPNNELEKVINNVFEGLNLFWKRKKVIHKGNIVMFYRIIHNDDENPIFEQQFFRENNHITLFPYAQRPVTITDYNKIPGLFEQLIDFINDDSELPLFLKMQIIHIHNLAIAPFSKHNVFYSKTLAAWYFNYYNDLKETVIVPIKDYLSIFQLESDKYSDNVREALLTGDYTNFVLFVIDSIIKLYKNKILTTKMQKFCQTSKRIYLAPYEKKMLFVIIFYHLDEFDWKQFKKTTKWPSSKQYIIKNLTKLESYSLLSSRTFKNRKFFYRSRFLKAALEKFQN